MNHYCYYCQVLESKASFTLDNSKKTPPVRKPGKSTEELECTFTPVRSVYMCTCRVYIAIFKHIILLSLQQSCFVIFSQCSTHYILIYYSIIVILMHCMLIMMTSHQVFESRSHFSKKGKTKNDVDNSSIASNSNSTSSCSGSGSASGSSSCSDPSSGRRVLVVGSSNVDLISYVQEHPSIGATITGISFEKKYGGKGMYVCTCIYICTYIHIYIYTCRTV